MLFWRGDIVKRIKENESICGMCCTEISNLSVSFGKTVVLKDVNLHIHCGELTTLIGPNGAGKTTLFKAIIGEVPHSGKIVFTDLETRKTIRPKIGYVPQMLETDKNAPISVLDLFTVSSSSFPAWLGTKKSLAKKALSLLAEVDGEAFINRRIGALSGGELQRVLLALALMHDPEILLLDEPVSGVDSKGLGIFYNLLDNIRTRFDLSVIVISHDHKRIAAHSDRFILLDREILVEGSPKDVLTSAVYKSIFSNGGEQK